MASVRAMERTNITSEKDTYFWSGSTVEKARSNEL